MNELYSWKEILLKIVYKRDREKERERVNKGYCLEKICYTGLNSPNKIPRIFLCDLFGQRKFAICRTQPSTLLPVARARYFQRSLGISLIHTLREHDMSNPIGRSSNSILFRYKLHFCRVDFRPSRFISFNWFSFHFIPFPSGKHSIAVNLLLRNTNFSIFFATLFVERFFRFLKFHSTSSAMLSFRCE